MTELTSGYMNVLDQLSHLLIPEGKEAIKTIILKHKGVNQTEQVSTD